MSRENKVDMSSEAVTALIAARSAAARARLDKLAASETSMSDENALTNPSDDARGSDLN